MTNAQRNNLIRFAELHGVRAEVRPEDGAVLVYIEWVNAKGEYGFDCDRVRNMRDLRILLGY